MIKTAYFAGGCFWCITPAFKDMGAISVISGYSGGDEENPTYEEVKHQATGHRETIAIEYDTDSISYRDLLETFLCHVDPYDAGGQFIDRGHSYTLAIYYGAEPEDAEMEKSIAEEVLGLLNDLDENGNRLEPKVALEQFKSFYPAEEYHQDYYLKHPEAFEKELIESGRKKA